MTGKKLLEILKKMKPEDLKLPVRFRVYNQGPGDSWSEPVGSVTVARTKEEREDLHDRPFIMINH